MSTPSPTVPKELVERILRQYTLNPFGIHGAPHWARVTENGRRLAKSTGAPLRVVELFAVFHDACRVNDGRDDGHGRRGADLAAAWRGEHFDLPDEEFDLLYTACAHHTDGQTEGEITVQTCWDADRLDLLRVGIRPSIRQICTDAGRDQRTRDWANRRAVERIVPALLKVEWGLKG